MKAWQEFEGLIERIHTALAGKDYIVEQDVTIEEPGRGTHQIDIVITPKNPFLGRMLVSCKSSGDPVEKEHVREWSDIVQQTGAASGLIVSPTGFTSGAIELAQNPIRRVSLWIARPLTDDDFAPDPKSPNGYIRTISMTSRISVPRPRIETFKLDAESATGKSEGRTIEFTFSAETRDSYYLRDEHDNVVGNLWDQYIEAAEAIKTTGTARVDPADSEFLVLSGHRLRFKSLSVEIEVGTFEMKFELDATIGRYGYENAVTGEVRFVPLA